MIRHAVAIAITVCLSPALLSAQTTVLTVNTASAEVYRSPSTGSPIIGYAPRGTVLAVTRELGSWVKVSWPDAKDGVGYVHISRGSVGRGVPSQPSQPVGSASARPASEPAPLIQPAIRPVRPTPDARPVPDVRPAPVPPAYVAPPTHIVGLGGRVGGSTFGFGATGRAWSHDRFGAQLEISRYTFTSIEPSGRVTSIQVDPSLLYSLTDRVTDYVWVRPYLGSGVNVRRQSFSDPIPSAEPSVSESKFGFQLFGGGEFTFASIPRFALSADLGYHWPRASFAGVYLGGLGVSVSGHWYVK